MNHGISENDWIEYLEGCALPAERTRIDEHLFTCSQCQEFGRRMARTAEILKDVGEATRRHYGTQDKQLDISLAKVLGRVLDVEASEKCLGHREIVERLKYVEELLATMCGSWTAINALRVAANSSLVGSVDNLTEHNWMVFLKKLTSITSVFCGDAGARLLWEYGQLEGAA